MGLKLETELAALRVKSGEWEALAAEGQRYAAILKEALEAEDDDEDEEGEDHPQPPQKDE